LYQNLVLTKGTKQFPSTNQYLESCFKVLLIITINTVIA
jgi:hypothetical protein